MTTEMFTLPKIYAIVDAHVHADALASTRALMAAGATLIQLRSKQLTTRDAYELAMQLRAVTRAAGVLFAVNDRADLAAAVEADVLHVGQDDLPPLDARKLFGGPIGLSTHTVEQVRAAADQPVAYLGFGPVFATSTKENPDAVTGVDGLKQAVAASAFPLVGIGGITAGNIARVWNAGAASAAVISALGKLAGEHAAAWARLETAG